MNLYFEYSNDYLSFLLTNKNNEIYSNSAYLELFPLDELEEINIDYETNTYVPNFIAIGSNGGGVGIFINKIDQIHGHHLIRHADGGMTTMENGVGLCQLYHKN